MVAILHKPLAIYPFPPFDGICVFIPFEEIPRLDLEKEGLTGLFGVRAASDFLSIVSAYAPGTDYSTHR